MMIFWVAESNENDNLEPNADEATTPDGVSPLVRASDASPK
jgi:hypothetical protein